MARTLLNSLTPALPLTKSSARPVSLGVARRGQAEEGEAADFRSRLSLLPSTSLSPHFISFDSVHVAHQDSPIARKPCSNSLSSPPLPAASWPSSSRQHLVAFVALEDVELEQGLQRTTATPSVTLQPCQPPTKLHRRPLTANRTSQAVVAVLSSPRAFGGPVDGQPAHFNHDEGAIEGWVKVGVALVDECFGEG